MSSDKFDDRIRDAAENHHPAYDEQAWSKMEKLLDKHLPVEKKKRRGIILFFFFIALFIGGAFFYNTVFTTKKLMSTVNDLDKKDSSVFIEKNSQPIPDKNNNNINIKKTPIYPEKDKNDEQLTNDVKTKADNSFKKYDQSVAQNLTRNKNRPINREKEPAVILQKNEAYSKKEQVTKIKKLTGNLSDSSTLIAENSYNTNTDIPGKGLNTINKTDTGEKETKKDNSIHPLDQKDSLKNEMSGRKEKPGKKVSFFLTASAGPDISFADSEKAGKMKGLFGVGAGFTIGKKITLRSGFYTGHKVYTATSSSYNPPPPFYTYYPYLEKVEADCKVYEIPLSFSYNFGHTDQQNWFASAGISSFLMKSETYNYYYKNSSGGPLLNREWSIKNQNNHFFSVLTLSGGFRRQLNHSVFIIGEPYLKLPLSGVGYGKVKLNSAGVLFTIGVTPFHSLRK